MFISRAQSESRLGKPVAEIFLGSVAAKGASLLVAFTTHRAMRCIEINNSRVALATLNRHTNGNIPSNSLLQPKRWDRDAVQEQEATEERTHGMNA
jgi:hypothetical protein